MVALLGNRRFEGERQAAGGKVGRCDGHLCNGANLFCPCVYKFPEPRSARDRWLTRVRCRRFAPPLTPISSRCSPFAPPCSFVAPLCSSLAIPYLLVVIVFLQM